MDYCYVGRGRITKVSLSRHLCVWYLAGNRKPALPDSLRVVVFNSGYRPLARQPSLMNTVLVRTSTRKSVIMKE